MKKRIQNIIRLMAIGMISAFEGIASGEPKYMNPEI